MLQFQYKWNTIKSWFLGIVTESPLRKNSLIKRYVIKENSLLTNEQSEEKTEELSKEEEAPANFSKYC